MEVKSSFLQKRIFRKQSSITSKISPHKTESVINLNFQNHDDTIQKIDELKKSLNEKCDTIIKLEKQLSEWKERCIIKEVQFRKIIAKYQAQKIVLTHEQLTGQYSQVVQKTELRDKQCENWLKSKYSDNLFLMEKRIKQIKKKAKEEVEKHQILSKQSFNDIMAQIESAKHIAKKIDDQNSKLHREIRDITLKYQLLYQQRNILLKQVIDKKIPFKRNTSLNRDKEQSKQLTERLNTAVKLPVQPTISVPISFNGGNNSQRQARSIDYLRKTLSRQKQKNSHIMSLFTTKLTYYQDLRSILEECIEKSKKDIQSEPDKKFHHHLIQNIVKSQNLLKRLTQNYDLQNDSTKFNTLYNSRPKLITERTNAINQSSHFQNFLNVY